ncbi:hypothetical protein AGMMS49992_02190 [Clostridia bacterium]|nr:hypothetical protein AGMMS49992_02190 [Clostridia bacterium]
MRKLSKKSQSVSHQSVANDTAKPKKTLSIKQRIMINGLWVYGNFSNFAHMVRRSLGRTDTLRVADPLQPVFSKRYDLDGAVGCIASALYWHFFKSAITRMESDELNKEYRYNELSAVYDRLERITWSVKDLCNKTSILPDALHSTIFRCIADDIEPILKSCEEDRHSTEIASGWNSLMTAVNAVEEKMINYNAISRDDVPCIFKIELEPGEALLQLCGYRLQKSDGMWVKPDYWRDINADTGTDNLDFDAAKNVQS